MVDTGGRGRRNGAIRVVTLNTWKGDGPYRRRLSLMAEGLAALDPDVVFLQESLDAPEAGLSTHAGLARELGLSCLFESGRHKVRRVEGLETPCASGLAILTRLPVREASAIALPFAAEDGERFAQRVVAALPDGRTLTLINTHLTHLSGRDDLRHSQLVALMAGAVGDLDASAAVVLGGDMNADRGSLPLDWLTGHRNWFVEASVAEAHFPTLADGGADCVDHLFVIRGQAKRRRALNGVRRVLDRPAPDGVLPSDHYGVMADLCP